MPERSTRIILSAAFAWAAVYLGAMLAATGGRLSMPLDDSFIFFQYARRLVEGHPFSYAEGLGVSSGATSLLTVLVHAAGYLAGFRGGAMSVFAVLLGAAALAWTAASALRLGRRLCPQVAWLPAALLLTSGPLLWGFMSGMDLPLFVALAFAFAADWPEAGRMPPRRFFLWGALLGLVRPDAVFLVLPAAVFGLFAARRRLWWALPVLGALLPFALQWLATGRPQSASMEVKSVLADPGFTGGGWLAGGLSYFTMALRGVLGGASVSDAAPVAANGGNAAGFFSLPFALGLVLLGLVPGAWLEVRARRPGLHLLLLTWGALLMAAVSFTVPHRWHWHRYLMPVLALSLPGIAAGAGRAGRWVEAAWRELDPGDGARILGAVLVALSLPGALFFTVAYGRNCADIRFQHIELAERLGDGTLPRPERLGVNDAGALAYFGDYPIRDLHGLTDPAFRDAGRLGGAGVWEALERMPADERPDYLACYPDWFGAEFLRPHRLIHSQNLWRPSIVGGNPMNLYRADWSLAGRGDRPRDPEIIGALGDREPVFTLDVADVASETAADYRIHPVDGIYQSLLRVLPAGDGSPLADGGRLVSGSETFLLTGLTPGRPLTLVTRTHSPASVRVETTGGFSGIWFMEGGSFGRWHEAMFHLPAEAVPGPTLRVRLSPDDLHHAAYGAFHYWVYQG